MVDDRPEHASVRSWLTLAALTLLYTLSFVDRQILAVMVEPIKRDLVLSDVQVSLLLGLAFAVLYTFAGLVMGAIADRRPRRPIVFFGAFAWSLATAACGVAGSFGQLFAARMAVGLGESVITPVAHSILSDAFPRRRLSLALALFTMGSSIGTALSLAGGGLLIAALARADPIVLPVIGTVRSWQSVFLLLGAGGIVLSGLIFASPEPRRREASPVARVEAAPDVRQLSIWMRERRQLWLAVCMTFVPMGILATVTAVWTPTYMARNFGWSPDRFGVALALCYALPHGLGQVFNGLTVDRLFARGMIDAHFRYFMGIALVSSVVGIAAYLVPSAYLCLLLLTIPSFLLFAGGGFGAAALQMLTPNRLRGVVGGFYMVLLTLPSLALGPTAVALFAEHVFRSQKALGMSIALLTALLLPVMMVGSVVGMRAIRRLVPASATCG